MDSDDEDLDPGLNADLDVGEGPISVSNEDSNSYAGSIGSNDESNAKRMYLETVNQDGSQTYVLTVRDESGVLHSTTLSLSEKALESSVDSPPMENVSGVSQAWFTSREDKSNLHNKGHSWKQGMWSKDEIDLLDANIRGYCLEHNILDPANVIFDMTKDQRKDFYRTIAKGLNRPLFSVYRRVIRMYDNKNHIGKYTPDEIDKLRKLRTKHGNDWQAIGQQMGRSASSIKDKCRLMKSNCHTGKWFPYEENRLSEAVYDLSNTVPGETIVSGISWALVAERVGTRSEKQCRTKWLNYLNWKQAGGSEWTRDDDVNLITKICSVDVDEENDIDWTDMATGWHSVRSPQWLRGKWWNLKRHVPSNQNLCFKAICHYLFTHHVANVQTKGDMLTSDDELLQSRCLSPILPSDVGLVTAANSTLTLPHVSVVQAPNVVQLPIQFKTNVNYCQPGLDPTLKIGTGFEMPPGLQLSSTAHPATFFITSSPGTTAIPYTTCTPTSTGQFIIHTVTAGVLQGNDNVSVHMNLPPQIIISTQPDGTNIATLAAPAMNLPTLSSTLQLTGSLTKDELSQFHGESTLMTTTQLQDQSEIGQTLPLARPEVLLHIQEINPYDIQDSDCSTIDDKMLDQSTHNLSSDYILSADPLLQGSDDACDLMVSASDLEIKEESEACSQHHHSEDCLHDSNDDTNDN